MRAAELLQSILYKFQIFLCKGGDRLGQVLLAQFSHVVLNVHSVHPLVPTNHIAQHTALVHSALLKQTLAALRAVIPPFVHQATSCALTQQGTGETSSTRFFATYHIARSRCRNSNVCWSWTVSIL
eukprot:1532905-Pyramimonas_sp.AAC.1